MTYIGPRNWVFHEDLNLERMKSIVSGSIDAEAAEQQLIDYYGEEGNLDFLVRRLNSHDGLRQRMHLLQLALIDYRASRYYATTLVLLTVMDGFVNDVQMPRKGLHARGTEEMAGWDTVVAHHLGLSHAHQSFIKGIRATASEEVFELHRNGILHGTLLNYDNVVVATKAWNRLFAVADWARSLSRREQPPSQSPSFKELIQTLIQNQRTRAALEKWQPSILTPNDPKFERQVVLKRARGFLEAWAATNYGGMAQYLPQSRRQASINATAGRVRAAYHLFKLKGFEIVQLNHIAAAVCEVDIRLAFDTEVKIGQMRWIRDDENGVATAFEERGEWVLYSWEPHSIILRVNPN